LNDSAIFRTFSKRNHNGGFIDEPEYPFIAIDEAFVNAVVHRDYGVSNPIRCTVYRDSLAVRNPGSIPQQVPDRFSLHETSLDSVLRNPKIVEWMRIMKDDQGTTFVRALSEGTRRMREEMEQLGLPAPHYQTNGYTTVTLQNQIDERLEKYASSALGEIEE
jgi:predicted HTH transcriptional regulator